MRFFSRRRVRLRRRYAHLYPELTPEVWLSAVRVARIVQRRAPTVLCEEQGCAQGRILCPVHFEFRGGPGGDDVGSRIWMVRARPSCHDTSDTPATWSRFTSANSMGFAAAD